MSTEAEEKWASEGPGPLLDVGFDIECERVVSTDPTISPKLSHEVQKWADEMQAAAREVHPQARLQMQPQTRLDHFGGFSRAWAVIYCQPGVDIDAVRARLWKAGQRVNHVTLYYVPPMA